MPGNMLNNAMSMAQMQQAATTTAQHSAQSAAQALSSLAAQNQAHHSSASTTPKPNGVLDSVTKTLMDTANVSSSQQNGLTPKVEESNGIANNNNNVPQVGDGTPQPGNEVGVL